MLAAWASYSAHTGVHVGRYGYFSGQEWLPAERKDYARGAAIQRANYRYQHVLG